MISDQPIHFDEKITRPIFWGKLSFPKRLEMFQFLQSKCQLTVQDCDDLITSLDNTLLNINSTPPDPNFTQVIQNTMTEIRLVQLNLADFTKCNEMDSYLNMSLYKCYRCNDLVSSASPVKIMREKAFKIINITNKNFYAPLYCGKCHIDIYKHVPFK